MDLACRFDPELGMKKHEYSQYLYFLPVFILVVLIFIFPFCYSVMLSFFEWNLTKPKQRGFIGLQNFIDLFHDPLFLPCLGHGLQFTFFSVVFEYLAGLVIALAINSRFAVLKNVNKALLMLPWAVPIAINSMVWKFMLSPNYGYLNQIFELIGMDGALTKNWLGEVSSVMPTIIVVNIWRSFPFYTIVLTAALMAIPKELYEAAEVDGATFFQKFRAVTMPGIASSSAVIIIFHIIWTFTNFDVIYLLTAGGPLNASEVLPTLMYRQAFTHFNMGYSSAIGLFLFAVMFILMGPLYTKFVLKEK